MKLMYVSRLFTGIETSVLSESWKPTGVPTIYKFIELICANENWDVQLIFCQKSGFSHWKYTRDRRVFIKGLNKNAWVLAGENYFTDIIPMYFRKLFREVRHIIKLFYFYFKNRPDIIYIDHANTLSASLFARFTKAKVVFRIMGVYPSMREALYLKNFSSLFYKWAYLSKFDLVVCTQDGTGVERWLDDALLSSVPVKIKINGVNLNTDKQFLSDDSLNIKTIGKDKTTVLFVGKLEDHKGCDEFIDSIIKAMRIKPNTFHGVIVGFGSKRKSLMNRIKKERLTLDFTFIERLPHSDILYLQESCDIYVSLNKLGNFSNANLEAMRMGSCMIIPENLPYIGEDTVIKQYIPDDAYLGVSSVFDTDSIVEKIILLQENELLRCSLRKKIKESSKEFIPTWDERVISEINLLDEKFNKVFITPPQIKTTI
jgi:glycosyltransferase involved in cell wall biosynthesis